MKAYYNQEKISSSLRKFFQKIFSLSKPHLKSISYLIAGKRSIKTRIETFLEEDVR